MMAEIFGEGVTYTSEAPEDEQDDVLDEANEHEDGYDAESEYADEPVDDADYDDED